MYTVYILKCSDGTFYTGIAVDVTKRLKQHKEGNGAKYTRAHGAEDIVYTEEHPDRSSAQKREAQIKKLTRREKEELII